MPAHENPVKEDSLDLRKDVTPPDDHPLTEDDLVRIVRWSLPRRRPPRPSGLRFNEGEGT